MSEFKVGDRVRVTDWGPASLGGSKYDGLAGIFVLEDGFPAVLLDVDPDGWDESLSVSPSEIEHLNE